MILEKVGNKYCLKDCKVLFPNFKGRPTRYNPEGALNFNVKIDDPAIAQELANDGFNVRLLNKLNDSDPDTWALKINLKYGLSKDGRKTGPQIKEVFEDRSAELNDTNVHSLDDMTIQRAIVEFRPFVYDEVQHKCSAWLNRAKFWVVDDWYSEGDGIGEGGLVMDDDDIPF